MATEDALDAAISVFRVHGFVGASIRQLVESTGRSRSSLYNEFKDKDGLFTSALGHYVEFYLDDNSGGTTAPIDGGLPCLLTRSCNEIADLPKPAVEILMHTLEQQWFRLVGDEDSAEMETQGTLALAVRHGLAVLAAAGVPPEVLRDAAASLSS